MDHVRQGVPLLHGGGWVLRTDTVMLVLTLVLTLVLSLFRTGPFEETGPFGFNLKVILEIILEGYSPGFIFLEVYPGPARVFHLRFSVCNCSPR